jgi:hypothetical protein
MIQTLFLGKTDYDRAVRKGDLPTFIDEVVAAVRGVRGDMTDPRTLAMISNAIEPWVDKHSVGERRMADYAAVNSAGYPAYLGGPFTFRERGFA